MMRKMAERRRKSAPKLSMTELTRNIGMIDSAGCRIDEMKPPLRFANDVVEKTSKRRIRATEKPKMKSLTQT